MLYHLSVGRGQKPACRFLGEGKTNPRHLRTRYHAPMHPTPSTDDLALLGQCLRRTLEDLHTLIHHKDNHVPADLYDPAAPPEEPPEPAPEKKIPVTARPNARRPASADSLDTLLGQFSRLDKQLKLIALAIKAYADLAAVESAVQKKRQKAEDETQTASDTAADNVLLTLLTEIASAHEQISTQGNAQQAPYPRE